jgi:hypothetical protein
MKIFILFIIALSSISAFSQSTDLQKECAKKGLETIKLRYDGEFTISKPTQITNSVDYEFVMTESEGEKCSFLYRCRVENRTVKKVDYTGHSDCNMRD